MKCPKCNCDIDDKMLVCPNCKKVLKLVCPKCNTINKTNTCRKCGFAIISRCYECGKINQTINEKCSKCGFSTYTSVAINSSNIDEFACLTIEFTNLEDIRQTFDSTKLADKFKANLDKLIFDYSGSIGLTREILDNIYVIRFNKDISFASSAENAINSAIAIQNQITELNFKLNKLINATLNCNIAVLKRDIHSKPSQYKSGFDIKLIYRNEKELKLLNNLQIITDSYVYEKVCNKFDLSSLTAKLIKNEMMTFFELNLKKYIKIPKAKEQEEEIEVSKLNILEENIHEDFEDVKDSIYDIEAINFEELKSNFIKVKSIDLIPEIVNKFNGNRKNIIAVKAPKNFTPKTGRLLGEIEKSLAFKNIYRVTCYDEMKFKPYGFFWELIANMHNFAQSSKLFSQNDFSVFNVLESLNENTDQLEEASTDATKDFLKDLISYKKREFPHPEDIRYSLFDAFLNIFSLMSDSLIYVENFEKIDDTSLEVLQLIFEKFNDLSVGFLITGSENTSLHKTDSQLLAKPYYTEILVKPTPFREIIKKDIKPFRDILDSYYMQKISQNAKGSPLYLDQAINYLLEYDVLHKDKDVFFLQNTQNLFIPTTVDELIIKRLKHLSKDKNAYKLLAMLLLIGPRVDFLTVGLLHIAEAQKEIKILVDKEYIYLKDNAIYIQNYDLYKNNFIASASLQTKQSIAKELLELVYDPEVTCPAKAVLYNILEKGKQEFLAWEELSVLSASMGDFSAYLNCSVKFLKLLNEHVNENSQKSIDEYKMEVYENISNLLYKYTPEKIQNIAQIILENLEKTSDDKKIIGFCNKMLQGCLISGDYSQALDLTHKILSKFPNLSINPKNDNFDINFFLISLIKTEILFSIGNLKDCVELGDELLEVITADNIKKLKPQHLVLKQFEELIFDALSFVAISRVILLREDLSSFFEKINTNLGKIPDNFILFSALEKTVRGAKARVPQLNLEDDKFSKIISSIIEAFNESFNGIENGCDYNKFAGKIYQAKISAKMNKLMQIELICDLLIGYSYFKLNQDKKASYIYYNVLETSTKNGLKLVTFIDWYLVSMLKLEQSDIDVAWGIANNAIIQLEKSENSSELLFYLFRILLAKILSFKDEKEAAKLCLRNAASIKQKHDFKFESV